MTHRLLQAASALLLTAMLVSCASAPATRDQPLAASNSSLEERAVNRWQLLIEGKPGEAYEYLTPGYRATHSRDEYSREVFRGPIRWRGVSWHGAECQTEDSCQASLALTYSVRMPGAGETSSITTLAERWVRLNGEWYHLPER